MPSLPATTPSWALPLVLLRAMRPKQWIKNLLVFGAFVFTLNERWRPLTPAMWSLLGRSAAAFALFSLISSSIYLINDVRDADKDRQHPSKRNRPVASGALSPTIAIVAALLFIPVCLLAAYDLSPGFAGIIAGYLFMQLGYIFLFKNVVLLDVFILAIGFVMRAVSGAVVLGASISPWLYTVTLLGSLFLGFCKRRKQSISNTASSRIAGAWVSHPRSLPSHRSSKSVILRVTPTSRSSSQCSGPKRDRGRLRPRDRSR